MHTNWKRRIQNLIYYDIHVDSCNSVRTNFDYHDENCSKFILFPTKWNSRSWGQNTSGFPSISANEYLNTSLYLYTLNYIFGSLFSIKNAFHAFFYTSECANNFQLWTAAGQSVIYTIFPEWFMFMLFCLFVVVHFFHSSLYIQADDGAFVAVCNVNITIRDVNNHAPKFVRDNYMATIAENTAIGKCYASIYIWIAFSIGPFLPGSWLNFDYYPKNPMFSNWFHYHETKIDDALTLTHFRCSLSIQSNQCFMASLFSLCLPLCKFAVQANNFVVSALTISNTEQLSYSYIWFTHHFWGLFFHLITHRYNRGASSCNGFGHRHKCESSVSFLTFY